MRLLGIGEFTHLGVCYDMNLSNPGLFKKALDTIDELGTKVAISHLFPDSKKIVFETCIYMKVAYYAKFSAWTLSDYRLLDKKVSKYYRLISKNRQTIASSLLYIPTCHGGMGFKRLSNLVQMSKLTLMSRLLTVGGAAGTAMQAMILRGFRSAGQFLCPGGAGTLSSSLDKVSWITSLVDWLREVKLGLYRPGCPSPAGNPSMLELIGSADLARRSMASLRGVACLGEIHMEGDPDIPLPGMEWVSAETVHSPIELHGAPGWPSLQGQAIRDHWILTLR